MAKARELKDIKLDEVSLVDKAANKKKFLFFKQDEKPASAGSKKLKKKINIVIDSDGTIGGTKIALNKEIISDLSSFSFYFYSDDDTSRAISCSYSRTVETDDGFKRSETFHLSKGDLQMHEDIKKQLEEYFGKDANLDFKKAEENEAIVKAIAVVNEYKTEFPDDLKKAVGEIAKQAGLFVPQKAEKTDNDDAETKKKTELEKAGKKLSKDTLTKINAALAALKTLVGELGGSTEKSSKTEKSENVEEFEKAIEEITKQVEGLEKKDDKASQDSLTKLLKELSKRIATVEKGTGIKKSLNDQDDDDDDESEDKKLWPSFKQG